MSIPELTEVVNTWCKEMEDLGQKYAWVQVTPNEPLYLGCSSNQSGPSLPIKLGQSYQTFYT